VFGGSHETPAERELNMSFITLGDVACLTVFDGEPAFGHVILFASLARIRLRFARRSGEVFFSNSP
jgi:hypothetical protein